MFAKYYYSFFSPGRTLTCRHSRGHLPPSPHSQWLGDRHYLQEEGSWRPSVLLSKSSKSVV